MAAPKKVNPKSLANLKRGGPNPRKIKPLSFKQKFVLACYLKAGRVISATADMAEVHPWLVRILLRRQDALDYLPIAEQEMETEMLRVLARKEAVFVSDVDKNLKSAYRDRKSPHARVSALELAYERTGVLARKGTTNISATANAAAAVQAGSTMKQIYKSKWLQDTENQIEKELIAERDQPRLPGTTETFSE